MGAGKSGLAQAIALAMRAADMPFRWLFEMDPDNPLGRDDAPGLPSDPIERSTLQWKRFLEEWTSPPTAIIDGRLFNVNIAHTLFDGVEPIEIERRLGRVLAALSLRRVLLIHLVSSDVGALLERTLETRQDWEWYSARINSSEYARRATEHAAVAQEHLQNAQAIASRLARALDGESVTIDVDSTSWDERVRIACEHAGVPIPIAPLGEPDVNEYLGLYDYRFRDQDFQIEIRASKEELVIEGHPFSQFGGADNPIRLIPTANGTFVFRSAPIELRIVEPGVIEQVHWHHEGKDAPFTGLYRSVRPDES